MNRLLTAVLGGLLGVATCFSQAQMSSGDLKGKIVDASGAVLPAATVIVTNIETGVERRASTDESGEYHFFILPPGQYELRVEAPGFAAHIRRPIQLTIGQRPNSAE